MRMSIMKRDVNFVFFILIIATVVSFAGFTAYYQVSFRNINSEYDTKLAELNQVTNDLLEKKAALLQTSEELDTTKKGREELGEKYGTLKEERDGLESERNTLKENLFQTRAELQQKTEQVTSLSSQLVAAQADAERFKEDSEYYESRYDSCKSVAESLGGSC